MWIQNVGEKLALILCHEFGMLRQKKERENIAKEKTEPSLSPAVIEVRWVWFSLRTKYFWQVESGLEQPEPSVNVVVCHETLENRSLDTDGVWGDPFNHDSP